MCDFPSETLLKMRRDVAVSADMQTDPAAVRAAMEFVSAVDRLRLAHEDLTGCPCWYSQVNRAAAS